MGAESPWVSAVSAARRLNDFERRALDKLLAGDHPLLTRLRRQLAAAEVAEWESTPTGFVTRLAVPEKESRLEHPRPFQILDVYGEIAGLASEAGFILFVEDGVARSLECQALGDAWPSDPELERLFYMRPKSLGSAELVETPVRDLAWALAGAENGIEGPRLDLGTGPDPDETADAGAAEKEVLMSTSQSFDVDPGETQDIGAVVAALTARQQGAKASGEAPPVEAASPEEHAEATVQEEMGGGPSEAEDADAEGVRESPAELSSRRTLALVTVNAVLATVLGIGLVAMLYLARSFPQEVGAASSTTPHPFSRDLLLEALLTFAVAGAAGACLANLGSLFRQSREPGGLPTRQELLFYLRPLVGALTALFAFFLIATAVVAFTGGTFAQTWVPPQGRMTYVAVALVAGFGAYEALGKLRRVLEVLF
jgi:hypothetical protein